jgi:CubicO group peptidase (beta-lactamase class C family)
MKTTRKMVLRNFVVAIAFLAAVLSASSAYAQSAQTRDITGQWQGTLHISDGPELRVVIVITKGDSGGWSATFYSIDQNPIGITDTSLTLEGSDFKFSANAPPGLSYAGTLSADGTSIKGTWSGVHSLPLELRRATKETAWPLPDPNFGHKLIPLDPQTLDRYVGRYQLSPDFVVTMSREGSHFYMQATGQDRFELFPFGEKQFFARIGPIEVWFDTDDHGAATGMVIHQGGMASPPGKRIPERSTADITAQCAAIDSMVAAEYAKHPIGSVTIGVVYKNQLVWTKSYGNADMEKKLPADKDTVYRIGSITKMFTAVMLEQLVDAGKVHLSDPVEKYFPEVNTVQARFSNAPPITLIQLATHTSGMDREPADADKYVQGAVSDWQKTLIVALTRTRFAFEPGTHYFYSNIGFATLGAALSRASGEAYLDYVPKHIFEPLGMTHTSLELNPVILPHLSKGYQINGPKIDADTPQRENENGRGYKVPNGAIYTTVGDLARFSSFLMGQGPDSVLKAAVLQRNLSQLAVQSNYQLSEGYVLGGMLTRRDNYTAFGHGGAVDGYQAGLYVNREASVGVIVLANALGSNAVNTAELALRSLDMLSKPK